MKALSLKDWADHLVEWIHPSAGALAASPRRCELNISGEIAGGHQFHIARSRDGYGSVLHLCPEQIVPLWKEKENDKDKSNKWNSSLRQWNQWWAKIAIRSGYLEPSVDPAALRLLNELRLRDARIDFIVDTNVLISGVGHWLVRCFGDVCDLVRTVVTDLEIQRFGDAKKWQPTNFDELATRTSYLAASRFLEYLREQHPVWRRLDIEEETALFVASASKSGAKEPGADTLLLRAVRRSLQDQVRGLEKLFVTGDQSVARSATHDLPPRSTVAAYVNPVPSTGVYLSSVHWWPRAGTDGGSGYLSDLATFCYEATCICDLVRIKKSDGSYLDLRSFIPDRNQFPSDWHGPLVWIEKGTGILGKAVTSPIPAVGEEYSDSEAQAHVQTAVSGAMQESEPGRLPDAGPFRIKVLKRTSEVHPGDWPISPTPAVADDSIHCVARVSPKIVLDVLVAVMYAVREASSVSERVFSGSPDSVRELQNFLRAVEMLDKYNQPGASAPRLEALFARNDIDGLSRLLTKASEYRTLIDQLIIKKCSHLAGLDLPRRSANALAALARLLGQAVLDNGELRYGGAGITRDEFVDWFTQALDGGDKGPLGGALMADISQRALVELAISPARLERALQSAMDGSALAGLDFAAGGTPERILEEEIAVLDPRGWTSRRVSADGLLGFRSIRRRS